MNLLDKILLKSIEEKILLKIFREEASEDVIFGLIHDFNEEFVALLKYKSEGFYDGIIIFYKADITRIRWEGNELKSVQKLIERNSLPQSAPKIDLTSLNTILEDIQNKYRIFSICTEDIDENILFLGSIADMDTEWVEITELGTMTELDRSQIIIKLSNITCIEIDSIYINGIKHVNE